MSAAITDTAARARHPLALAGLTVVLPCYDEEANIAEAIRAATTAAERCAVEHQIVVVDDGSNDATATIARRAAAGDARVVVVDHERNEGYGAAVRSGIRAATMPWILLTDADLQFDLLELATFLPAATTTDLILGWRIHRRDPLIRGINGAAWNWLVRQSLGVDVRDVDCAFKLVRRDLTQRLDLRATGAVISAELLLRATEANARITQLGVHHHPRTAGTSSGAQPRVVIQALRELRWLRSSA